MKSWKIGMVVNQSLSGDLLRGFDKVSIDFYRKKLKVVLPEESSLQLRALALR